MPPASRLLTPLLRDVAVGLGGLGDLGRVHLPLLAVLPRCRLLIGAGLIGGGTRTQRSGEKKARTGRSQERGAGPPEGRSPTAARPPAVGTPEPAPRQPRGLAVALHVILSCVALATAETQGAAQEHRLRLKGFKL